MIVAILAMAAVVMATMIMVTLVDPWNLDRMRRMRLEQTDAPSKANASQKCRRQFRAVMGMELHLRQNVRKRDAQKDARRET